MILILFSLQLSLTLEVVPKFIYSSCCCILTNVSDNDLILFQLRLTLEVVPKFI